MRISDWSSDVCSSDLIRERTHAGLKAARERGRPGGRRPVVTPDKLRKAREHIASGLTVREAAARLKIGKTALYKALEATRSEEHTSELQSLMRISYAVFCLKKKKKHTSKHTHTNRRDATNSVNTISLTHIQHTLK